MVSAVGFGARIGALLLIGALAVPALASAGGIAQLERFVEGAASARGEFEQVVTASSGRKPQRGAGNFVFERPGKFRWEYETPYPQLLVSDGTQLWSWDPDLNQATVQAVGNALGNTPAAILAGDGSLERNFALSEAGQADGLAWVRAVPREQDTSFESIRIGLANGELKRMELQDHFGQTTVIDFRSLVTGIEIDADAFRFTPPPGADVIGG